MKKLIFVITCILIMYVGKAQDTIVMWSFPKATPAAEKGTPENIGNNITTGGGTEPVKIHAEDNNKSFYASCTGWDNGIGKKYWKLPLNTKNFKGLKMSYVINGCKSMNGPRDFKVQYQVSGTNEWKDVPNSDVKADTGWAKGTVTNLLLPEGCNNVENLFIRIVITSDTSVYYPFLIASNSMSKIDNILITGKNNVSINEMKGANNNSIIYPNPVKTKLFLRKASNIEILDIAGNTLHKNTNIKEVDVTTLPKGIYFIRIIEGNKIKTEKVIKE